MSCTGSATLCTIEGESVRGGGTFVGSEGSTLRTCTQLVLIEKEFLGTGLQVAFLRGEVAVQLDVQFNSDGVHEML